MKLATFLLLTQVQSIKLHNHDKMKSNIDEQYDWAALLNWSYAASKFITDQYNEILDGVEEVIGEITEGDILGAIDAA